MLNAGSFYSLDILNGDTEKLGHTDLILVLPPMLTVITWAIHHAARTDPRSSVLTEIYAELQAHKAKTTPFPGCKDPACVKGPGVGIHCGACMEPRYFTHRLNTPTQHVFLFWLHSQKSGLSTSVLRHCVLLTNSPPKCHFREFKDLLMYLWVALAYKQGPTMSWFTPPSRLINHLTASTKTDAEFLSFPAFSSAANGSKYTGRILTHCKVCIMVMGDNTALSTQNRTHSFQPMLANIKSTTTKHSQEILIKQL